MKNGHTTRQKTPAGRYALLDELRGLDLVSMMLYHACWDMMFLFGIWMDWYISIPPGPTTWAGISSAVW